MQDKLFNPITSLYICCVYFHYLHNLYESYCSSLRIKCIFCINLKNFHHSNRYIVKYECVISVQSKEADVVGCLVAFTIRDGTLKQYLISKW